MVSSSELESGNVAPTVIEDREIQQDLDESLAEGVICLIMKKKCDRHMGWQKTRENDFETELRTVVRLNGFLTDAWF